MIMHDDKKKMVAMIIKKISGEDTEMLKSPTNEMGDEVNFEMGFESAAESMMNAIEKKDKRSFLHALRAFISMALDENESCQEHEIVHSHNNNKKPY